jgi:signal transduction histidine kinase
MARPVDGKVDVIASPEEGASTRHKADAHHRLWSPFEMIGRWWAGFALEQRFSLVTAIVVTLAMAMLGYWVERSVRAGWTQSMAEVAATYVEAVVAPHLSELETGDPLSAAARADLTALITGTPLGGKVKAIKVWSIRGDLIFSTAGPTDGQRLRSKDLARLLAGEVIAPVGNHPATSPSRPNMIEVYAPVFGRRSPSTVVGIAEFYNTTDLLNREVEQLKYALWFLILNVSMVVGVMLYALIRRAGRTIARQQGLLEQNLARAAALAKRNRSLRQAADRARVNAAVTNEEYLSRIGADLHDGPIQMLSLMMLRLPPPSGNQETEDVREQLRPLIEQTLGELRNLSAGLVLPDIRDLSPLATIEAAVSYHERNTGTKVTRQFADLPGEMPEAIRICAFRVVQEALMNAYKHADGKGQRVEVAFDQGHLLLLIEDAGHGGPAIVVGGGLGLRGMRTRVTALRGSLSISRPETGGLALQVRLPVRARSLTALVGHDDSADHQA